jgi:hypothetical protein
MASEGETPRYSRRESMKRTYEKPELRKAGKLGSLAAGGASKTP